MLWLLFGCLETDSGLGINTPQTGREAAERFSWLLLRATVPALPLSCFSPQTEPQPGLANSTARVPGHLE